MSTSRFRVSGIVLDTSYDVTLCAVRFSLVIMYHYYSDNESKGTSFVRCNGLLDGPVDDLDDYSREKLVAAARSLVDRLIQEKQIPIGDLFEGLSNFYSSEQVRTIRPFIPPSGAVGGYRSPVLRSASSPAKPVGKTDWLGSLVEDYASKMREHGIGVGLHAEYAIPNDSRKGA